MTVEGRVRAAFRRHAHVIPAVYNYRSRHNSLIQRARGGVHEADFQVLRDLELPRPLVIDVGANTGQTIISIKSILPNASITSLEPSPRMLAILNGVASKHSDVRILPVGASDGFSVSRLHVPVVRGLVMAQYASILPVAPADVVEQMRSDGFRPGSAREVVVRTEACVLVALDSVAVTCDILKVDVEGHEESVFAGASTLLHTCRPILIVERPSPTLRNRIAALGYRQLDAGASENRTFVHPDFARGVNVERSH